MINKLSREAEHIWRRLNVPELIRLLIEGVPFKDGIAPLAEQSPADENIDQAMKQAA